jgi:hypothetical protein
MKISNCKMNNVGFVYFDAKFAGMRKPQDLVVYPKLDTDLSITVQSGTRIGTIHLTTGIVKMSPGKASGSRVRASLNWR